MSQAVRRAKNETFFREANDQAEREVAASWGEKRFLCECSARGCVDRIPLTKREYEHVRAVSDQFFVVPGHEDAEVEIVVERFPGYLIVAKFVPAGEYADGLARRPTKSVSELGDRTQALVNAGNVPEPRRDDEERVIARARHLAQ